MLNLLLLCIVTITLTAPNPQYDAYENELMKIVKNIQANLNKIATIGNDALKTSQQFNNSEPFSTQLYAAALKQMKGQSTIALGQSIIPFHLKNWSCTGVPNADYSKMVELTNKLQANDKSLSEKISQLNNSNNCPQVSKMNSQKALLTQQIKLLQTQINQFCPNQTISNGSSSSNANNGGVVNGNTSNNGVLPNKPASYVNNLENGVNNWIYGNVNPQVFYAGVNKQLSAGAVLCSAQTPYIDTNNNCISCPLLYDVAAKKCASCPSGSTLNKNIHQCDTSSGETIIKNPNPSVDNYIGSKPSSIANLSTCTNDTPYFNGVKCISCSLPNYFDFNNLVCLTCGQGLLFDTKLKICKPIDNSVLPNYANFNSNLGPTIKNYAGNPPQSQGNLANCSSSQPYFNGMNCISCTLPLYFNFTSKVCQACQFSYMFDSLSKQCVVDASKIYYSSSLNGVSNYIGTPPILASTKGKVVRPCPANTPFSNGMQCVECSTPKFFNFITNLCEKCSNDLIFNISSKSCSPKLDSATAQKNSNIGNINNFMYAMPLYNDSLSTCDQKAPFFNGAACISCDLPLYFNFKTLQCEGCPSGLKFNSQNRLCEYNNQKFISNTANPNIYYNGNYQAMADSINAKRLSDASIQLCPTSTPFYQATTNQCIACPPDLPIFNLKYSKCISCGADSSFDPASRICIYNKKVGLSLERTLMNTFSF